MLENVFQKPLEQVGFLYSIDGSRYLTILETIARPILEFKGSVV